MITYEIISRNLSKPSKSPLKAISPSDEGFHETVFHRALKKARGIFKPNDLIKVKGTSVKGKIVQVYEDLDLVQWQGNRPHFIEVELNGNDRKVVNPAQIRKYGNKR